MKLSERRACRIIQQPRMTQRYKPKNPDKDKVLVAAMKRLAGKHPRYGYRLITGKLRQEGWQVNKKRIQRLWRKEGLQVPYRRKRKKYHGSYENDCSVKRAEYIEHVWTYAFVEDETEEG